MTLNFILEERSPEFLILAILLIMLLLGLDIGTSSIKVSVVDTATQQCIASTQYPETESLITAIQAGWAEQSPDMWWQHCLKAILKLNGTRKYNPYSISAIGIAYQMHGLVLVDKEQNVLRDSIIWCDSRAVKIGEEAFNKIGPDICSSSLLNSPGNFTASKLAWVKKNEPEIYARVNKMMLPGDFISMRLTGRITTTASALSEGILWDFKKDQISEDVINYFHLDKAIIPDVQPVFSNHGCLLTSVAQQLSLQEGIPITYKAGDQLNNALSLNVNRPGEVAATAGTSGVIYAVTDRLVADKYSRVNTFAHINHTNEQKRLGVLLCINGTGILNSWVKKLCGDISYKDMDEQSSYVEPGSEGLFIFPFGNGAERMLRNKLMAAHINNIDFNKHSKAHLFRAAQEGIAFAFRYGIDIMRENGLEPSVVRAGKANLFLSDVFIQSFVNATGVPVELYANDGSVGAAMGAGVGSGIFTTSEEAFNNYKPLTKVQPTNTSQYNELYLKWKNALDNYLLL